MVPAPNPVPPPAGPPTLPTAWPFPAQLALAFLLGVTTTLLAVQVIGSWRWGGRPSDLDPRAVPSYRVNLNRAERAELLQLPGVGESLAQRIEDHRSRSGGFRSVDELAGVKGIGPATLQQLRPWVYVDAREEHGATAAAEKSPLPNADTGSGSRKVTDLKEPIDINRASLEELQRLPGIGPKLSQRIVDERRKGPFKSVEDLRRVSGIGPKTVERLRPLVCTNGGRAPVVRAD